jgi:RNA polymerase sigma-70 factor (ECF subfamily)
MLKVDKEHRWRDVGVAEGPDRVNEAVVSDEELFRQIRDGSAEALALLFRRHRDPLYRYLVGLTRQRELAEDLLQETFIRLWRQGSRLPDQIHMSYVYRIAVNLVRDHTRRTRETVGLPPDWERRPSTEHLQVERLAEADVVARALATLSADQRITVGLHYFADQPVERVGQILGIPAGTVKTRLHWAYRQLAQAIARQEERHE